MECRMKRIGYILLCSVGLLVIATLVLAQLETPRAKSLLRVMTGKEVRGYYGTAVSPALAFKDTTRWFAVSATGETDGPVRVGKVFLYDNLLSGEPVLTIRGGEGELFGTTLATGDWNGDGIPDLAVGAPAGQGTGSRAPGKVYLYLGGEAFGAAADAVLSAGEAGDAFGAAICMTDDINGDSLADLVVGAPYSRKAGATAGRAYVWFGRHAGGPGRAPDAEIRLGTTNDLFGTAVATGDVNGDGQADLVIGSPHDKTGDKWLGSVTVIYGGKKVSFAAPSQVIWGEGTSWQDEFGTSVAVVPDMNGDGAGEILVGAPQVTDLGKQVGKVYLFHGGAKIEAKPSATYVGSSEAGRFGQHVFSLGDVNGDGKGDWAAQAENEAGSRGVIHFFYGGWDRPFQNFTGETVGDRLGSALAVLRGMSEGGPKVLVGARWNDSEAENAGRVYLLQFE
jgi:hypothetical protein